MSKHVTILDNGVAFSNVENVFGYSAFPSVARDADGNILMVCTGDRIMHVCPYGKVLLLKSKDEGRTWSSPMIAIDTPLDDRDAGILNLGNGRLLLSTFTNTRELQRAWADGGKSGLDSSYFGANDILRNLSLAYLPAVSDRQEESYIGSLISISENNGFSWGEPFKVPVTAPHGPSLLKDGSLIYAGTPYFSEPEDLHYPIAVYRSDNHRDFYKIASIPVCPQKPDVLYSEPHIIELPNGRMVLHIRMDELGKKYEDRLFSICQSVSDDGGKTWSVPALTGATGAPPHLFCHSSGTLISAYGRRIPGYGIHVMISKDHADHWDLDYYIWDRGENVDLGYPATVELDNGDLFTVYYAMRPGERSCSILWTRWKLPK